MDTLEDPWTYSDKFLIVAVLNGLNCTGDLVANIGLILSFF